MLAYAKKAAELLAKDGIRPTVVDARFAKPLDRESYAGLFARHRAVLTIEDNVIPGGYGEAVALLVSELGRNDLALRHMGLPDEFVTHGDIPTLHKILGLDQDGIHKKAVELLAQSNLGPVNSQLQPKSR
jgi:1-deoxy-D-xylulose-5-phosphate synthase